MHITGMWSLHNTALLKCHHTGTLILPSPSKIKDLYLLSVLIIHQLIHTQKLFWILIRLKN